jgi:hypothetical protein
MQQKYDLLLKEIYSSRERNKELFLIPNILLPVSYLIYGSIGTVVITLLIYLLSLKKGTKK